MFNIKTTIGGNTISANIQSPVVRLISSNSGTGKSLYADLLIKACDYEKMTGLLVNYCNLWRADKIIADACSNGIIIFDNIEQYLDKLSKWLPTIPGTVLLIGRGLPKFTSEIPKARLHMTSNEANLQEVRK